ncbi:hypothetical protein ALC57_15804 [Trachymyrmex cornetzi]|uniref:Uncharacterized protein n=1 Tax=Trachymyrmex cornetzi TaxID=471704 RepID=A0A151IW99_9HYME|nr:hypothetical protein ALC57_15804 [Trachymyrmex cornetzi]
MEHLFVIVTGHLRPAYIFTLRRRFRVLGSLKARWAPASSHREPLTTLGLNNVKASSCVSTNTSSSLTFVGSSENVGRDPSPSPARSRHYQTPMYLNAP